MKNLLLFGLVILACSQASHGQNCQADSFELTPSQGIPFIVHHQDVTISVAIKVKQGVNTNGQSNEEYVKNCVDKIQLQISQSQRTRTQEFDLPTNLNLNAMLFRLTGLKPVTEYSVTVSYIQTSPNNKPVEGYKQNVNTCFDNPTAPRNVKLEYNKDGSGKLRWEAPEQLNSPRLCYYAITKRKNGSVVSQEIIRVEPDVLSQVISKEEIESSGFIQVNAVNDISCYLAASPFAQQCRSPLGAFTEVQVARPSTTPRPTTRTTSILRTTTTVSDSTRLSGSLPVLILLPILALVY